MKSEYSIQFRVKSDEVIANLPISIRDSVKKIIQNDNMFSSIRLEETSEIAKILVKNEIQLGNESLIRLIRYHEFVEFNDIIDSKHYELKFISEEVALKRDPIYYYNTIVECEKCGRSIWIQSEKLELKRNIKNNLNITNNGEIIVNIKTRDLLSVDAENIDFRETNLRDAFQIITLKASLVKNNSFIVERDYCSKCNKPRIVKYENTNNVDLFDEKNDTPRIEKIARLDLVDFIPDISFSNYEFGTLGWIPEGAPQINNFKDRKYKTAFPKIIVSGKIAKLLLKYNSNILLQPCGANY